MKYINIYTLFLLRCYKMRKTGDILKKAKWFFCFADYKYVAYLLNQ